MDSNEERRKFKRIKITAMTKLNNCGCSIVNVSKNGLLVSMDNDAPQKLVNISLKINGKWLDMKGNVMWAVNGHNNSHKKLGIYITHAPPQYKEFIDNLYLEANEN
jgi:hypothetical protein